MAEETRPFRLIYRSRQQLYERIRDDARHDEVT